MTSILKTFNIFFKSINIHEKRRFLYKKATKIGMLSEKRENGTKCDPKMGIKIYNIKVMFKEKSDSHECLYRLKL